MNENLESSQKLNIDEAHIEHSTLSQAGRDLFQDSVVTFNETQIIQLDTDTIKNREFIPTSPYKGLKKFEPEDHNLFFGRDQFITGLVNELAQTNLILLLGASGSGKSSLIRAGLIPWLTQKWGSKKLVKLIFTPDLDPFESLYGSLLGNYKQSQAQIAKEPHKDTLKLVVQKLKNPDDYWLIFIDQFEELFTISQSEKCDLFIESLVELTKSQPERLEIVATMRADFLDKLSPYAELIKATDKHRPLIAEMQKEDLRLAIEQPAAHHGVVLERGLADDIINDIYGQAGYLPLLQYTLNLLWETEAASNLRQDRTLHRQTYQDLGRVQGALQRRVEGMYQNLSAVEKLVVKKIFLKLVDIGDDQPHGSEWKPVRHRSPKSRFTDELEQKLLTQLIDENLLVSDMAENKEATIDIAHEIILTSWQTLNNWIKENRQAIAIRNRLNNDLKLWEKKKSEDELWTGAKLQQALELSKDQAFNQVLGGFTPAENEFINASLIVRERKRQRTLWTMGIFSTIALSFAMLAGWQWRQAEITKSDVIARSAALMLSQGQELDALIASLRAGILAKRLYTEPSTEVVNTLKQSLLQVRERNRLERHRSGVNSVSFSPDGQTLASSSGSGDSTIILWDVQTGQVKQTLKGHNKVISSVSFSRDGKTLVSSSGDQTIKLWDVQTGQVKQTLNGHNKGVNSVKFSPDHQILASGSDDQTIKLWDVNTGQVKELKGHSEGINSVSFSRDGQILASGSDDKTIKLWDLQTYKEIKTLAGHGGSIFSISFSPDGQMLATGSKDKTIKLWNVQTGQAILTLPHQDFVSSVSFSDDGNILVSSSWDKTIKLWDVKTGKEIATLWHRDRIYSASLSPDARTLASGSKDQMIKLWDLKKSSTLSGHNDVVLSVSFSPDGQTLASGSTDTTIKLWDLKREQEIRTLSGHDKRVSSVSFSPDGNILASASADKTIKLWNVKTGEALHTLSGHIYRVLSVSFSPDGNTLASASGDKTIKLWDVKTGAEIKEIKGHSDRIYSVIFSPDGKTLASGSGDKTIKLWDVKTGAERRTLSGHQSKVLSLSFSRDGQTLASGSQDNKIKLWNVGTGEERQTLSGHNYQVLSVRFSPDGHTLASSSMASASDRLEGTIKLWDVKTGKLLRTIFEGNRGFFSIDFSKDDKILAAGRSDGTIILWDLNFDSLLERACDRVRPYLQNPDAKVEESDRHLCDGINSKLK